MSYSFIDEFLEHLYKIVHQISFVQNGSIKGVYLNVNDREEFPCIYIMIRSIEDKSRFDNKMYQIEFEILVYVRQQGNKFLIQLASEIQSILTEKNCAFAAYDVIGVANNKIDFAQARDLISSKLSMYYQAMIVDR